MKLLKSALLLLFTITTSIFLASGQDTVRQSPPQQATRSTQLSKEDPNKDFDSHMAKLQQSYGKMKSQESKVKDPKMKADMDALIAKMSQVNNEYTAMKNNTGMSEQQQQESRKHIQMEMKEIRKMHDDMKEKYGDQMGGKGKKSNQQKAPPEESTDPLYK